MKQIDGGVTAAKGFQAAGVAAGIKYKDRKDMALVFTKTPATAAGTFTTNVVKAAPVLWDKQLVEAGKPVHAVVLNSGIANACTGEEGKSYNLAMASAVAQACGVKMEEVPTASTGVIGMQLRMEPVKEGVKKLKEALSADREGAKAAAEAIMTTDTVSKECAVTFEVDGTAVTVGGMSKGSGMIHPNMATMLSVITTDAAIGQTSLQEILSSVVSDSFNMISVDRDTSTNDTCLLLANGESGVTVTSGTGVYEKLKEAVQFVACELANRWRQTERAVQGFSKLR